jgi:hypothetical protein
VRHWAGHQAPAAQVGAGAGAGAERRAPRRRRERAWKLKQGRKFARAVARSNLNVETRAVVREREAQAAVHRRAAWISKEARPAARPAAPAAAEAPGARGPRPELARRAAAQVMRFWGKAERVVAFKRQQAVEALKKEAMDKHLSFLLGQTQRYSSLLAQRLAPGAEGALPPLPPPRRALSSPPADGERPADGRAPECAAAAAAGGAESSPDGGATVGSAGEGGAAGAGAAAYDAEEGARADSGSDASEAAVGREEEDDEATLEEEEVRGTRPPAAVPGCDANGSFEAT